MTGYAALFRSLDAETVGGLPMRVFAEICAAAGLSYGQAYVASNNVVFQSDSDERELDLRIQQKLHAGGFVGVHAVVRSRSSIEDVIASNPFPGAAGNRVLTMFTNAKLPRQPFAGVSGVRNEKISLGSRELYVFYPDGTENTELSFPVDKLYTARNLYTITKLAEMAASFE